MIYLFIIVLFLTLLVTRVLAHTFHDRKSYGKKNEKSKTITAFLRNRTGFDWHHFHLGIILLIISTIVILTVGSSSLTTILFAIALSLIVDQVLPILNLGDYFSKKVLFLSILLHILIAILSLFVLRN